MQLLWHSCIYRCQATGPQVGCYLLEPKTLRYSELREICHRHVSDNKDRTFAKKLSAQNSNLIGFSAPACLPKLLTYMQSPVCVTFAEHLRWAVLRSAVLLTAGGTRSLPWPQLCEAAIAVKTNLTEIPRR